MAAPNFAGKTDAELFKFCTVKSAALTRLQKKIDASKAPNSHLERQFGQTAELLNGAVAELQSRYP